MDELTNGKTMTTKDVAEVLGVTDRTVRGSIKKLGKVLSAVRTNTQGGYLLTEKQVSLIKQEIQSHHNLQSRQIDTVSTEIEENETILKALSILKSRSDEYKRRAEIAETKCIELQPKADYADTALKTENQMSITDAGKTLGIRQSVMFEFLRRKDLLTCKNVPTQRAIDKKVLTLKSYIVDNVARKSACLTMQNLKNFKEIYIDTGILVVNELDKIEKQGEMFLESKLVKEIN